MLHLPLQKGNLVSITMDAAFKRFHIEILANKCNRVQNPARGKSSQHYSEYSAHKKRGLG